MRTQSDVLRPGEMTLAQLRAVWDGSRPAKFDEQDLDRLEPSRATVRSVLDRGAVVYGINTGFGLLANTVIKPEELATLQRNLVLSHSTGVGAPLPREVVRLVLTLKIGSLLVGHSGVRRETVENLLAFLAADAMPVIPSKGSVGASGDLAPLAHMSAALLGVGDIDLAGSTMNAADALEKMGLAPLELGPKEGLALLNGTQVSTALCLAGLFRTEDLFAAAVVSGAASVDAAKGSDAPFDDRIHRLRRHPGQIAVAATFRQLLAGSAIRESHRECTRVQDPYCLRCQPQVMGACLDVMGDVAVRMEREANAVTDNPLVFADDNEILSGGNFHAEPVAFAADELALVLCEIGNMSERRTAMLIDPNMSGLPAFLVKNGGINSGFMIAQVTSAALASENKCLASPASIDTIPTSANQEDHVSMATHGARRLADMTENVASIVGIEALAAVQGIECHRPATSSPELEELVRTIRSQVEHYHADRFFAPDLAAVSEFDMIRRIGKAAAALKPSQAQTD